MFIIKEVSIIKRQSSDQFFTTILPFITFDFNVLSDIFTFAFILFVYLVIQSAEKTTIKSIFSDMFLGLRFYSCTATPYINVNHEEYLECSSYKITQTICIISTNEVTSKSFSKTPLIKISNTDYFLIQ